MPKSAFAVTGGAGAGKRKSRIGETPTLLTDAHSRTDTNLKRLHDLSKKKKMVRKVWGESKFLAALSSSRSLVVCPLVGRSVGWSVYLCENVIFRLLRVSE